MRASASSRPASPSASPAVQVRPLIHLILSPTPLSTKMMMQWTSLSIHLLVFSEEHLHRAARHQLIRAIRRLNPNNHRILFYFSFLFWSVSMETKTKELFGTHISIILFLSAFQFRGTIKGIGSIIDGISKKKKR